MPEVSHLFRYRMMSLRPSGIHLLIACNTLPIVFQVESVCNTRLRP